MARPEYNLAAGVPMTFTFAVLAGAALTAFAAKTGFIQFRAPRKMKIIGITLTVNQRGGTHSASALNVLAGGTTVLAATFSVNGLTPGTPVDKEGSDLAAAADAIAKDTLVTVNLTESGGTSPTWADVTLQIDAIPLA